MAGKEIERDVNERIVTTLKAGTIPWRSDFGFPRHIIARRRYAGLNAILLMLQGFKSPYWGTRQDWEMVGG